MKKYPILLLIVGLALLIAFQSEVVMPLIYKVVQSDLFLVESKDEASQMPISNTMTDLAFAHCNAHIKSNLKNDALATFSEKPLNVWSLGNYQYVVNAEYTITEADKSTTSKYACRITYNNSDEIEGAAEFKNWTIDGLSEPNHQ